MTDSPERTNAGAEWRDTTLKDVAQITMGQSPPGSTYNEHGDGLPFFQGSKDFNYRYPTQRIFCSSPKRIAENGDILFSVRAPIGRVNVADRKCAVGRGLAVIKPHATSADARYVEFYLRYMEDSWGALEGGGTVFGTATKRDMENLAIVLPPLSHQRRVSAALGALDDKIDLNARMNETLDEMSRALFQAWFVDFVPVRAKISGAWRRGESLPGMPAALYDLFPDALEDSALGETPAGWEVKALGDLADAVGGGTPSTKEPAYWEGGTHRFVTPKDLANLSTLALMDAERRITDAGLAKTGSGLLPVGSVLLSSRATIGYLAINEVPLAVNQGFIAMKPKPSVSNIFLAYTVESLKPEIISRANGTTFLEISKRDFRPIPTTVPAPSVMSAFDIQTRALYDKMVANERESRALAEIRDTLLPKLLSGEASV